MALQSIVQLRITSALTTMPPLLSLLSTIITDINQWIEMNKSWSETRRISGNFLLENTNKCY
jgi:hypothetical protein